MRSSGNYPLEASPIYLKAGVRLYGAANNQTVLDFSNVSNPNNATVIMYPDSTMTDFRFIGSLNRTNATGLNQAIDTTSNNAIVRLHLSHLYYGINLVGAKNITLKQIGCEYIQDTNDFAACIHGGRGTENVFIDGYTVLHSSRGIEMDAGAKNVTANNGYLDDVG